MPATMKWSDTPRHVATSQLPQKVDPTGKEDVTVTINGTKVQVPYGTTILNAARNLNIYIP
ncbi:MAG: 2Fe-2S iron-sulfur cluster-binding protein, partial [Lentisphaerota bacterium]